MDAPAYRLYEYEIFGIDNILARQPGYFGQAYDGYELECSDALSDE